MLLDRYRHQGEEITMKIAREGDSLNKAGFDFAVLEPPPEPFRQKIQSTKNIGFREDLQHFFQNFFRAGVSNQPLMDDRYARRAYFHIEKSFKNCRACQDLSIARAAPPRRVLAANHICILTLIASDSAISAFRGHRSLRVAGTEAFTPHTCPADVF
jgi:hypothetical protein